MIAAAKGSGGKGLAYSAMKSKWTNDIAFLIRAAKIPRGLTRILCAFEWVSRDRRHDPDNIEAAQKFIWDALKLSGVLPNDGWEQNAGSTHSHRVAEEGERPGVWVTVMEVPRCGT
jgi:hypothetical protein